MSTFRLIAFDMDGTLLNSKKEISEKSVEAINRAFDEGKEVILSTGRCVAELKPYLEQIPRLRYMICVSGALVYDVHNDEIIYQNGISREQVWQILEISEMEDILVHMLTTDSIVQKDKMAHMEDYAMGDYRTLFENVAIQVDNIHDYYGTLNCPVEKINLHHLTPESRLKTRDRLSKMNLVMADSDYTSVELSAPGTTKGTGLERLCQYLNIPIQETIAVGDADNDIDVLKKAGLSIAMGNANDNVKSICKAIVKDCDSEGCAQAIYDYLLNKNNENKIN